MLSTIEHPTVLFAVLNMGLGHATRSLSLIRGMHERGWRIVLASSGRALWLLQKECPWGRFAELPDYSIRYARGSWLLPKLSVQIPRVLQRIVQEHRAVTGLVRRFRPELIVSDHRYGVWHPQVPSVFLSHQIRFAMPPGLSWLAPLPALFNRYFHRFFARVLIPDEPQSGRGRLSGDLSRPLVQDSRYHFIGILSSVKWHDGQQDIDVLVSISGPEPQRSLFEQKVLSQIGQIPGRRVVFLGKSETAEVRRLENGWLEIHASPPRQLAAQLMNRARKIISRPGYSTLMELAELGKPALFVPTPGQTEQQYLARRLARMGLFPAVQQNRLDLPAQLDALEGYPGLQMTGATEKSVQRALKIFRELTDST